MTAVTANAPVSLEDAYKMIYGDVEEEIPEMTQNYLLWLKGEKEQQQHQ